MGTNVCVGPPSMATLQQTTPIVVLFNQCQFPGDRGAALGPQLVDVDSRGEAGRVKVDRVGARRSNFVAQQLRDPAAQQIVDFQAHLLGFRQGEADRRSRVKRIGEVLIKLYFLRQI